MDTTQNNDDWMASLYRMRNLGEIVNAVKEQSAQLQDDKAGLINEVNAMKGMIKQIEKIITDKAAEGMSVTSTCKEAIKKQEGEQKEIIMKIAGDIKNMTDMTELKKVIGELKTGLDGIVGPSAPCAPGAPESNSNSIGLSALGPNIPSVKSTSTTVPTVVPSVNKPSTNGPMVPDAKDPNNPANNKKPLSSDLSAIANSVKGGYTYGKSRKKEKGRRRRTKKSRKKGKGSKRR